MRNEPLLRRPGLRVVMVAMALCLPLLALPARAAAPTVSLALSTSHGLPGSKVLVTVTVTGCTATAVHVSFSGVSARLDETNMTGSEAEATMTSAGVWQANLTIAADAASGTSVGDVDAVADCAQASPPPGSFRSHVPFRVDGFDTQRITVSPNPVVVGRRLSFLQTGGRGSCWVAFFRDAVGTTWNLWIDANFSGPRIDVHFDGVREPFDPPRIAGSFVVPRDVHPGRSTITIHCSQSVEHPATFTTVAATSPSPSPASTTSPPAVVVPTTPVPTAATPSPTTSPAASPSAAPAAVATHKTAYGRSIAWGGLLGLLAAAAYGITRRLRLRGGADGTGSAR